MAMFCIPKNLVKTLKESALKGKVDLEKLVDMSSAERRKFFTEQTDVDLGPFLNTKFEEALVSSQKDSMLDWAKSVFTPKAQEAPVYKSVLDKIKNLDEIGVLDPASEKAFLEDLVSDRLGINVSPAEVKAISEKAKVIQEAQERLGNDLGNPSKTQENIDFLKAKKEMDNYLMGLLPSSNLKILTGTIGRGAMLASFKSPLLNIGSNIEVGLTEAMSRRLAERSFKGADNKLAVDYVKFARKVYSETGFDIARMMSLADTGGSGGRVLDNTVNTQGAGKIRKAGRIVEDIVFKNLMGAPDAAFASAHFADSVNINALKAAKGDVAAAREMMVDAMRIKPQTEAGEVLRAQGVLDAQVATWTNKTWASRLTLGIRSLLNDLSGDARVGDYVMPFVKTPANVIATGVDYAGGGAVKALVKTADAMRRGEFGSEKHVRSISRDLVRSGLGLAGAVAITMFLDDDDFVGAYDPDRAQYEELRGSNYNAFRVGDKWISTDWLGPLAISVTAIMYARKYGSTPQERAFQYGKGVFSGVQNLPGISDVLDLAKEASYNRNRTFNDMAGEAQNYALEQAFSRLVPSLVGDIAKAADEYQRETGEGTSGIQARIPGEREKLPIKQDVFGNDLKTEDPLTTLLFGARVRTDRENPIISEVGRLIDANDKSLNFTDWDDTSSKMLAQFAGKVGPEKYDEAQKYYGQELQKALEKTISSKEYKSANDAEKLELLNDLDADTIDKTFARYKFKYVTQK